MKPAALIFAGAAVGSARSVTIVWGLTITSPWVGGTIGLFLGYAGATAGWYAGRR